MSDLPDINEAIIYVRGHGPELFPKDQPRKTIGNVPETLHEDLFNLADDKGVNMYQLLAAMLDFYNEYEEVFSDKLEAQRVKNAVRR